MKFKRLSVGMKVLIASMLLVAITLAGFGASQIFAEPTIEDLTIDVERNFGAFQPSEFYDPDKVNEITCVGWLKTTQLFFNYDRWVDTNGDGIVDSEDVLSVEGFETGVLMNTTQYPVLMTDQTDDYYIVPMVDYVDFDGAMVNVDLGANNDFAELVKKSYYWYDNENALLYIDVEAMPQAAAYIERGEYSEEDGDNAYELRVETIMLVKDAATMTRSVNVATVFDASIGNLNGIDKVVPNEVMEFNVINSKTTGVKYQLIPSDKLPYISSENLVVYENDNITDSWSYDETTGEITINCNLYLTHTIVVKICDINKADVGQTVLQATQTTDGIAQAYSLDDYDEISTALADTFEQYGGVNPWLHCLRYEEEEPQIGAEQMLGWSTYGVYINKNTGKVTSYGRYGSTKESLPDNFKELVESWSVGQQTVNGWFSSTVLCGWYDSWDWGGVYGEIVGNLFLNSRSNDDTHSHLVAAMTVAKEKLFDNDVATSRDEYDNKHPLTSMYNVWIEHARYFVGTNKQEFLGGTMGEDDGIAMFDASCCQIRQPSTLAGVAKQMNNEFTGGSNYWSELSTDLRTNATLVDVQPVSPDGGYLYVCIWSRSMNTSGGHAQRILAFSKVPYHYSGTTGWLHLIKTAYNPDDPEGLGGEQLGGAVYKVYKTREAAANNNDALCVATLTTSADMRVSVELPAGTYYVTEVESITGYLLDDTIYEVNVGAGEDEGLDCMLNVVDHPQTCQFQMTVYDYTTKGNSVEVPVGGLIFELWGPKGGVESNNEYIGTYISNKDGWLVPAKEVSQEWVENGTETIVTIPAFGEYKLIQINEVVNYRFEEDETDPHFCQITIDAHPTDSGKVIDYTGDKRIKHYEKRQTVHIKSHVQDENLGDLTTAQLGQYISSNDTIANMMNQGVTENDAKGLGSFVSLENATYSLYPLTDLLLGYTDDGQAIVIKAVSEAAIADGTAEALRIGANRSPFTVSSAGSDNRAYIQAMNVFGPDGLAYKLPNGVYMWKLISLTNSSGVSTGIDYSYGYYNNGKTTEVDASWSKETWDLIELQAHHTPVKQTRQTTKINLVVKSYMDDFAKKDGSYYEMLPHGVTQGVTKQGHVHQDGPFEYTDVSSRVDGTWIGMQMGGQFAETYRVLSRYLNSTVTKIITSDSDVQSDSSNETATVYATNSLGDTKIDVSVQSYNIVPNTVYELTAVGMVVDVITGETIHTEGSEETTLGMYLSDEHGNINIEYIGSEAFTYYNPDINGGSAFFEAVIPHTVNGKSATHVGNDDPTKHPLPNGIYILTPVAPGEDHAIVKYLSDSVFMKTMWTFANSNEDALETNTVTFMRYDPPVPGPVPVAPQPDPDDPEDPDPDNPRLIPDGPDEDEDPDVDPNPPTLPDDPYDPLNPEDPTDPDDSEDIPLVDKEWVLEHQNDVAYRIIDSDNVVLDDNGNILYDVKDMLPTTFAFFVEEDDNLSDEHYKLFYYVSFYYEISEDEYNRAMSINPDDDDYMVVEKRSGYSYYKKFSNVTGDNDYIKNIIALNEHSTGFYNGYEVQDNRTVSGAIYNTEWLNEKLSEQTDGEFHIIVRVDTTAEYLTKASETPVRITLGYDFGYVKIRNRQLFPLD